MRGRRSGGADGGVEGREIAGEKTLLHLGVIAASSRFPRLAEGCARELEAFLAKALPDLQWRIQPETWRESGGDALFLLERAQEEMSRLGWRFSFILREKAKPSNYPGLGTVYFSHSSAIIDIPPIPEDGAGGEGESLILACCHLILDCLGRLNGLPPITLESGHEMENPLDEAMGPEELGDLNAALRSLTDAVLSRRLRELRGFALYLRVLLSHPRRVLRAVASHHPLRMVFSLGRLAFAAVAALVLSLLSVELWALGIGINIWRLALIAVAVWLAATTYVVFQQRLYVRRISFSLSEQAVFFNLTNFLTVLSVFLALFALIFVASMLVTTGVYPRYIISEWLGGRDVGLLEYVRVSLLIASLSLVVGALGAGLEENRRFRGIMYVKQGGQ